MFNSSMVGDSSRVSSRRSSFSQTCALLSKYVKENKAFGDLSFDLAAKFDDRDSSEFEFTPTTMDLFPVNEKVKEVQKEGKSVPSAEFTVDWSEMKSAPLTIFCDGELVVFNDFPAHKMKEILELATEYSNEHRINLAMSQNSLDLNSELNVIQELATINPLITTVVTDLPQKRRASLQSFMGKRKERVKAKAPYSMSKPEDVQSKLNPDENTPWLELAPMGAGFR